jgi:hypothetical protein
VSEPDPDFDAVHPSGHLMFRSCRGGYLHGVVLSESAMDGDADTLAEAVLRAADVSHLKSVMQIRREIIEGGFTPTPSLPTPVDLDAAEAALRGHRLDGG